MAWHENPEYQEDLVKNASCTLEYTIFYCKDCDWSSEDEYRAKIHKTFHYVVARYFGPGPLVYGDKWVGRCSRCGMHFMNKAEWIGHENTWPENKPTVGFYRLKNNSLENQERLAYAKEPKYVRRFKDSPGSPRIDEETEKYHFKKERKELKGE